MLIWVLFLNKHGKKTNYPTAEQRSINRYIHNCPKRQGINPLFAPGGLKYNIMIL